MERQALRRLLVGAVVLMGVLILLGMVAMGVVVNRRLAAVQSKSYHAVTLDEPAGTRIAAVTGVNGALALTLSGGGPDRVVMVNPVTGAISARVALAR